MKYMAKSLFEYSHYRSYLRARLEGAGARGSKAQIAQAIGVQATYVSQVLQENSHLSLEQAEATNGFFNHTTQEAHFFLLLVQKDRAGTATLRAYFQKQLDEILNARLVLTERLGKATQLEEADRSWYYSSWIPSAVHIATTIPTLRTVEAITRSLQLPSEKIVENLERLERIGLVIKQGLQFLPGQQHIRIGKDSHHVLKHHTNWRMQAIQSLDREKLNELHYSAVVSLSAADILKIKDLLLESINNNIALIRESKEEELYCLTMDFFSLQK